MAPDQIPLLWRIRILVSLMAHSSNLSLASWSFPESDLHIRWPKYRIFNVSISPSNEHSGLLICFRLLILFPYYPRNTQESSPAPQFKSINCSVLSLLYDPTLTSIHDYWKSHSCDYMDLCHQSGISAS